MTDTNTSAPGVPELLGTFLKNWEEIIEEIRKESPLFASRYDLPAEVLTAIRQASSTEEACMAFVDHLSNLLKD